MDRKRGAAGDADMSDLRLKSRQSYLAKREAEQLALLRIQVAEEASEVERLGDRLSAQEKADFRRNAETLRLAEARNNIDEHFDGYTLPDAQSKSELLTRTDKDPKAYKTEYQQWEDDQMGKIKSQVKQPDRVQQDDYEYVFDETQAIKWVSDGKVDMEKQRLQQMLDESEMKAKTIEETRKSLPVYKYKDQLLEAIKAHQVLIVIGETGSGKTTQIPHYVLLDDEITKGLKVACTQPRRVAAISVAQRVAEEMGERVGKTCGYMVRFEEKTSPDTKILYCTDGLLLRILIQDPELSEYGLIMIDEAHERTLSTDILMGMLKEIILIRPDLKVIISSATITAQSFSQFLYNCPLFSIPGRSYPVEVMYSREPESNYLSAALTTIWQVHIATEIHPSSPSDILVFLTGEEEILAAQASLEETAKKLGNRVPPLEIRPLYSALPSEDQQRIFLPASVGTRKCILSTNLAETSLTIDGVTVVIDTGYEKQNSYDGKMGLSTLTVVPCSRASANQRAGRAGRNRPGRAYRLFTRFAFNNELPEQATPEIMRQNLLSTTLLLKSLGVHDLINFNFMDPPPTTSLIKSLELLYGLGCLDSTGALTRHGRKLSELPIDPLLGKAILAASDSGCSEEVVKIIAMLGETHALFLRPKDKRMEADNARRIFTSNEGGDFMSQLNVYSQAEESDFDVLWAKQNFLQSRSLNRARDVRDQLEKLLDRIEVEHSSCGISDHVAIRKALTAGLFPNAARLQRDGQSYRTLTGSLTVFIHPSSVLSQLAQKPKWVIYYELVASSKEYMRNVMPIEPEWLVELAPHYHKADAIAKLGVDKKMGKGPGKVGIDR
ncbi:P-loop containing nucleoside triphosphate hydrolase protein [Ophiobolus disseminans]|uniref:RNA helicase n=1 Tax=Ophiobolus disseminans TaxID=1469910 RepID=A0A6A6ZF89_9PLEO|nr:P-loop containing nucleoside triphosphate hydrolase protein [Ophiobolus disseminans]